jgi:hypothetical protein
MPGISGPGTEREYFLPGGRGWPEGCPRLSKDPYCLEVVLGGPEMSDNPLTIWDVCRTWTGRSLLGRLLRDHGEDAVKAAIVDTLLKGPAEPKTYLTAILVKARPTKATWQMSNDDLYLLAKDRGVQTKGKTRQELINELR